MGMEASPIHQWQGTTLKDRTGENRVGNMTVDVGAFESAPSTAPFLRVLGTQERC